MKYRASILLAGAEGDRKGNTIDLENSERAKKMIDTLLGLYKVCFPWIIRAEQTVKSILELPGNFFVFEKEKEENIAVSVINKNTVLLFCVLPHCRNRGIGSGLLEKTERHVRAEGFDTIQFCDGPGYITPGIPMYEGNEAFFTGRGYVHSWGECECVDMMMNLADFVDTEYAVGDTVNGIQYRWAKKRDYSGVLDCVDSTYPEFTKYYRNEDLYGGSGRERVLIAVMDGKVCGALMVSNQSEAKNVGSVGCTVTGKEYQGRGIAMNMVRLGTGYLKSLGLEKGFLGYTYTDIIPMYARSGYKVSMKYFMGKKELRGGQYEI